MTEKQLKSVFTAMFFYFRVVRGGHHGKNTAHAASLVEPEFGKE